MNKDIKKMLKIYKTIDRDWLGFKINKKDILTRHHIIKKVHWEINDISNYAILTEQSHQLLHKIENENLSLYNELNRLFMKLNQSQQPVTEEYYEEVSKVLKRGGLK